MIAYSSLWVWRWKSFPLALCLSACLLWSIAASRTSSRDEHSGPSRRSCKSLLCFSYIHITLQVMYLPYILCTVGCLFAVYLYVKFMFELRGPSSIARNIAGVMTEETKHYWGHTDICKHIIIDVRTLSCYTTIVYWAAEACFRGKWCKAIRIKRNVLK